MTAGILCDISNQRVTDHILIFRNFTSMYCSCEMFSTLRQWIVCKIDITLKSSACQPFPLWFESLRQKNCQHCPLLPLLPGFQIFLSISIESASASWKMIWSTFGHPAIKKKYLVVSSLCNKYSIQGKDMSKDSKKVKVGENQEIIFLIKTLKSQRVTLQPEKESLLSTQLCRK